MISTGPVCTLTWEAYKQGMDSSELGSKVAALDRGLPERREYLMRLPELVQAGPT
jgi:hypothetical protein